MSAAVGTNETKTIHSGYCTNVHAGADLEQTWANLKRFAPAVRQAFLGGQASEQTMGIGLWLSSASANKLIDDHRIEELAGWLHSEKLMPFTLNGFPFGDFHQQVVKHRVYKPTWFEPAREAYTRDLIGILHQLLPPGVEGSISTLPIAWAQPADDELTEAALALQRTADHLAELERSMGRLITVCIEPEPGCYLQRSDDMVRFFKEYLFKDGDEEVLRRHIRICHDICHAAVMFETQEDVLQKYADAGIAVGKVQVSSAVRANLAPLPVGDRAAALQQLAGFKEERYLHQTMVQAERSEESSARVFYEDLDQALAGKFGQQQVGEWRTHFHVPIYLQTFGKLEAMQDAILDCLAWTKQHDTTRHYEVETYAWGVLPAELQQPDLALGIAQEMSWFTKTWASL